jgi:hypothetical protein
LAWEPAYNDICTGWQVIKHGPDVTRVDVFTNVSTIGPAGCFIDFVRPDQLEGLLCEAASEEGELTLESKVHPPTPGEQGYNRVVGFPWIVVNSHGSAIHGIGFSFGHD